MNWCKERQVPRLRADGVAHINDLEDMSNAFACTASDERFRASNGLDGTNNITIEAFPSCSHFVCPAEAPKKLFANAHERPIAEWFEGTKQLSKELKAVGLDGNERDISLEAFADDVFWQVWYGMDKMRRRVFAEFWICQIRRWMRRSRLATG